MIIINFKTYPKETGEQAVELAKLCQEVSQQTGVKIILGLQPTDIYRVASKVGITIFGQHSDPVEPGRNTGMITAYSLKQAGATGVFLNHSEHPFANFEDFKKAVSMAKKDGLEILAFAKNLSETMQINRLKPDYLCLEEPSLISKQSMVSFPALQQTVFDFCGMVESTPLVGAGIKTKEDVSLSVKGGAKGIVFASEFLRSLNKKELLQSFTECFK